MLRLSDPRALRAIAHPLRARLLDELHARGASRAADLAAELGEPANSVSFHLRQLAKHGLIVEAPERARDRRDRWWQPAAEGGWAFRTRDVLAEPGGEAAVRVWSQQSFAWKHAVLERFRAQMSDDDPSRLLNSQESTMLLTRDEAVQFADELNQLTLRWAKRGREHADDDDDGDNRRTYLTLTFTLPYPDDLP